MFTRFRHFLRRKTQRTSTPKEHAISTFQDIIRASKEFEPGREYTFYPPRKLNVDDITDLTFSISLERKQIAGVVYVQKNGAITLRILPD